MQSLLPPNIYILYFLHIIQLRENSFLCFWTFVIIRIYERQGLQGLYKGFQAQILKTVLGAAIALMLKEKLSEMQLKILRAIAKGQSS